MSDINKKAQLEEEIAKLKMENKRLQDSIDGKPLFDDLEKQERTVKEQIEEQKAENALKTADKSKRAPTIWFGILMSLFFAILGLLGMYKYPVNSSKRKDFLIGWVIGYVINLIFSIVLMVYGYKIGIL